MQVHTDYLEFTKLEYGIIEFLTMNPGMVLAATCNQLAVMKKGRFLYAGNICSRNLSKNEYNKREKKTEAFDREE